jgi:hypothetical protein
MGRGRILAYLPDEHARMTYEPQICINDRWYPLSRQGQFIRTETIHEAVEILHTLFPKSQDDPAQYRIWYRPKKIAMPLAML